MRTLKITWRDENYGSIHNQVAFRCYDTAELNETQRKAVRQAYVQAGFIYHDRRASWMADRSPNTVTRLAEALGRLGYGVEHKGNVPAFVGA